MTVSYTAQVASCKRFGCFWKLLLRWKGSIYKLLWPNLFVYVMMYSTLSITYRFLLNENQRTTFEKLSLHCQTYGDLIPVSFVLGFYVSIVVKRWWDQYTSIPWPDPLALLVSAFLPGEDERSRLMRRTIVRYACLSIAITLRMMCPAVKKRFPTMEHMVEAGLMLPNEKNIFDKLEGKTVHPKYWLPLVWAASIITRARKEDKVKNDFALKSLIDEVNKFRSGCGSLLNYDWISVPLVYTQVVTLAVFTYFMASLMGNQYLNPLKGYPTHTIDLIVPIFTLLQFFFYMGWLMVAETLVNPFGEDDDDFEVNWLIDRNLQISYLIVDEVHEDHPALVKDQYWEEVFPTELPYTEAAKQFYMEPFLGSAEAVQVPMHQRGVILMPISMEAEFAMKNIETPQANPLQIKSLLSLKTKSSSFPSVPRKSSSKSVLGMLRKNIYEEYVNVCKRKTEEISMKQCVTSLSVASKSQAPSLNSAFRNNFNDFQEDIFRMSDFSMTDSMERSHSSFKSSTTVREAKINSPDQQESNCAAPANIQTHRGNTTYLNDKGQGEQPRTNAPRSDLNALVYFNEAEQETVVTNPCIRSHWKRGRIDTFLINKSELYLDNYMSKIKQKISAEVLQDKDESNVVIGEADNSQNLQVSSEIINFDELILLEPETPLLHEGNNARLIGKTDDVIEYSTSSSKNVNDSSYLNVKEENHCTTPIFDSHINLSIPSKSTDSKNDKYSANSSNTTDRNINYESINIGQKQENNKAEMPIKIKQNL